MNLHSTSRPLSLIRVAFVLVTIALLATVVSDVASATTATATETRFGAMFGDTSAKSVPLASGLEAQVIRKGLFVSTWTNSCAECLAWRDAGVGIVLSVRNSGSSSTPSTPVVDFPTYRSKIGQMLDVIRPEVLVVENEEDAATFFTGTTDQYVAELQAACEVAHGRGIPCTNGGLTSPRVVAMTYQNLVDTGQAAAADAYARATSLTQTEYENLVNPWMVEEVRARADKGISLATRYQAAGADFVNVHWYREDPIAFGQTIDYLEAVSGLPAMSNEVGQYDDDPAVIDGLMRQAASEGLAFAIWFSLDYYVPTQGLTTRALHNLNGTLRPHGAVFSSFMDAYRGTAGERQVSAAGEKTTTTQGKKQIRIFGTITGDPACLTGQVIKIQQATDPSGKYWSTKYTVTTDASGSYSHQWIFNQTLKLRAMAPAAGTCRMGTSATVTAVP